MSEQDKTPPPADPGDSQLNYPSSVPPPKPVPSPGFAQPPAPQSPGPDGAFRDRPAAPPGPQLPPGQGAPLQPGLPLSVSGPIAASSINIGALLFGVGGAILLIVVIAVILHAFRVF